MAVAKCAEQDRFAGVTRFLALAPRSRGFLLLAVVLLLASALMTGSPLEQSKAIKEAVPADSSAAQTLIFKNERPYGGGTLVARNWVLTAAHVFSPDATYSLRFGITNANGDMTNTTNRRVIDRIIIHPNRPDLAMAHFADPVPEDTWIPHLAAQAPPRYEATMIYGWGPQGRVLNHLLTLVIDPEATENAAHRHSRYPVYAASFPENFPPMVTAALSEDGDSGSGVFSPLGVLSGVHVGVAGYQAVNGSGNLYGQDYMLAHGQPVWRYREWIQSVIDNDSGAEQLPQDGPPRRQLTSSENTGNTLPITLPPPTKICDEGQTSCAAPSPTWAMETLQGPGNYRGTALAVCAKANEGNCTFNGTTYASGSIGRLPLGPLTAPESLGTREVMVWCSTSTAFADDAAARPALRISFTNLDKVEAPTGMGWWDVLPDQIATSTDHTPVDTTQFTAC